MSSYTMLRVALFVSLACAFALKPVAGEAQTIVINDVTCTAEHGATVSLNDGVLKVRTGGCGQIVQPASPPGISEVIPSAAAAGDAITIKGVNLAGASVTIAGKNTVVVTNNGSQIVTSVPAQAAAGAPGGIVVTTAISPPATYPFTVTAAPASIVPNINSVSPISAPVDTVISIVGTGLAGASVSIGGVGATILSSSSTLITAKVPVGATVGIGKVTVTTSAGTSSREFTVSSPVLVADVSIDGIALPNPSKFGNVSAPRHAGLNGAGAVLDFEVNAYAMSPSRCQTTPPLTRSWQHNISLDDYQGKHALDYIAMKTNEALSYKFTVGNIDIGGGFQYADAASAEANIRPAFMTVTEAPCDFDVSKVITNAPHGNGCYVSGINGTTVNWANISGDLPISYCRLQKGKTYYLNIRFQDVRPGGDPSKDSCAVGDICGGILQFF